MKIMAKGNRFPSLSAIADTGNGHVKFAGKIGQRYFLFVSCPVAKPCLRINARFLTTLAETAQQFKIADNFGSHWI